MRSLPFWLFWLVSGLICIPILAHPHLPMVDLPNHIARLHIAASSGTALDQYYSYDLSFSTNVALDAIWLSVGQWFMSAEAFSNMMIAVYAVSFVGAITVLARVIHGRWMIWPLAANLVVFNEPYFWGFANYLFTVPAAILAFALWLWLENRPLLTRVVVFIPLCLAMYMMHVLGLLILTVAVFGREVQVVIAAGRNWLQTFGRNLVLGVPFLIPVAIIAYGMITQPANLFGSGTRFGSLNQRLEIVTSPVHSVVSEWPLSFHLFGYLILLVLVGLLLTVRRAAGPRLRFNATMVGPAIALMFLVLCTPKVLTGVGFVHIRFAFVFVGVLIAATSWVDLKPKYALVLFAFLAMLSLGRIAMVERMTATYSSDVTHLKAVLDDLPAGSRILPVRDTYPNIAHLLWHIQGHAVPTAHAFVPTLFLGSHNLKLHEQWWDRATSLGRSTPLSYLLNPPLPDPNRHPLRTWTYLQDWQDKFTHVLLLTEFDEGELVNLPLIKEAQSGAFTLYQIEN